MTKYIKENTMLHNNLSNTYMKGVLDPISNKMEELMAKIESKKFIDIVFRKHYINEYNKLHDLLFEKYAKFCSIVDDEI